MTQLDWGIHWFRRDLRLTGNAALSWSWRRHEGRVLGFFCFDPQFLSRPDFSPDRFGFFLETLHSLREEMRAAGGDLLVLGDGPRVAFPRLFSLLKDAGAKAPCSVSWNRDYEPFARSRDEWALAAFAEARLETHTERDHLLFEPEEIVNAGGGEKRHYSVYSPFARKWFDALAGADGQKRVATQRAALGKVGRRALMPDAATFKLRWPDLGCGALTLQDVLAATIAAVRPCVRVPLPPAGHAAALKALRDFAPKLDEYKLQRDFPARRGTSRLSIYIKNGSITVPQVVAALGLEGEDFKKSSGKAHYLKELAWREFYYHILWHRPDVETQAFLPHTRALEWENRDDLFEAWKLGRTGYPIVDAGMRELATTGWMHNRVRMIVASFLVKDLLIDWRWGERYFMERLLDGDLAPNNGGWQWAASTGCDPQPYFRVFNPELQGLKFDPEGDYVRAHVPELARLKGKTLHAPPPNARGDYVSPVVQHHERRARAIAMFDRARETAGSSEVEGEQSSEPLSGR